MEFRGHLKLKKMSTKIVKEITDKEKLLSGTEVTPVQLKGLSDNLFSRLYILENGELKQMDCSNPIPKVNCKSDTKTAYFDKNDLDSLFKANPNSNGLLIHFGIHDKNTYPAMRQPGYQNKLMVVLSTTTNLVPNLSIGNVVEIAGVAGGGGGMDNGKLCPPDTTC